MPLIFFALSSCVHLKYGYTHDKAINSYNLITVNENNFGNKRLKYNIGHYSKECPLNFILNQKGSPDFIYEYTTAKKGDGIKLFYAVQDSAFIFEQPNKNILCSGLIERRKMTQYEVATYRELKK